MAGEEGRGIPRAAWILAAAFLVAYALLLAARAWLRPFTELDLTAVFAALTSALPFLLASAVVVGAVRWPAGRRWLHVAAVALVIVGMLDLLLEAWFVAWENASPQVSALDELLLQLRSVASVLAYLLAFATLATGLWVSRPVFRPTGRRRWLLLLAGLAGGAAAGQAAYVVVLATNVGAIPRLFPEALLYGLLVLDPVAIGLLGLAAVAILPRRYFLPELLVAAGAGVMLVAILSQSWLSTVVQLGQLGEELTVWPFYFTLYVQPVGMLAIAFGFALGRASAPGAIEPRGPLPTRS